MLLTLKSGVTYGPVLSRRLGRSLGINLLGGAAKICTFDCAYCQYGWTLADPHEALARGGLPAVTEVLAAVETSLKILDAPPAFLTFSGNGEPTLHPELGEIVAGVGGLRDRLAPSARVAVLSNSSRLHDPRVREALMGLDLRIMKLDAGDEATFRRFNRPRSELTLAQVLAGLRALGSYTVQALFADGPDGNASPQALRAWVETVAELRPEAVQLYTLDRGYPSASIGPVGRRLLESVGERVRGFGIRAEIIPPRPSREDGPAPPRSD